MALESSCALCAESCFVLAVAGAGFFRGFAAIVVLISPSSFAFKKASQVAVVVVPVGVMPFLD